MSDKSAIDQREDGFNGGQAQQPRKGHFKRFWWAYLVALCVIVVIIVPVIILVAVPKIAQRKIDEAQLEVRGITASNTQSDNFTMSVDSVIRTDGSVHATIDSFDGIMYLEDWAPKRPFVTLRFPETTSDAYQEIKLSQFTPITDMEAFTVFNTWLLTNDSLRVTVEGNTNVHVRGISRAYGVTFKKTITMPGLRGFDGTTVGDPHVSILPDARGNNFNGTAVIPNYSRVTFEIGNATFTNYLNGTESGTVYIDNMTLKPGNNSFPMRATVNQQAVLAYIQRRPACETGVVAFQLVGKDVVNNGQHLSYFADSLASHRQTVNIDIGAALKAPPLRFNVTCKD